LLPLALVKKLVPTSGWECRVRNNNTPPAPSSTVIRNFMRSVTIIFIIFLSATTFGQSNHKPTSLNEIGWTITLPASFTALDSATIIANTKTGERAVEGSYDIKADASKTMILLSATKNSINNFTVSITPFDTIKNGQYNKMKKSMNQIMYTTLSKQFPQATIDTSTDTKMIDKTLFGKFQITIYISKNSALQLTILSKLYKLYDLNISYLYIDDETRKEIEAMLGDSKFVD
jgi:hypothetical protein